MSRLLACPSDGCPGGVTVSPTLLSEWMPSFCGMRHPVWVVRAAAKLVVMKRERRQNRRRTRERSQEP